MDSTIHIRVADLVVIFLYLAGLAALGIYFSRRNKTTDQYFLGDRNFPGWAIGLSLVGTSISSVTFLAHPAAAYALDWRQFHSNWAAPVGALLAVVFFIPIFRQKGRTTAFEYLEERFGPVARLYGAISFIGIQVVRTSSILYLVAIPISVLTGLDVVWVIVISGVFIGFYTVAGGIAAVIWTDVTQTIILIAGGAICLAIIAWDLPGGLVEIVSVANAHDKFSPGSMAFSLSERTFPTVVFLGLFIFLTSYASNQSIVQRYMAASSLVEARKATLISAGLSLPIWASFFFLGTSLFVYYNVFPDQAVAKLEPDQVFPHFMFTQLPPGVAGLIVAAVLSAAMSSLDSSINASAMVGVTDLVKRYFAPHRKDEYYLKIGWALSVASAILMIGGAIVFHSLPKETIFDQVLIASSLFGGCLMGMFFMGFFTTRVGYQAVLAALLVALLVHFYLVLNTMHILPASLRLQIHDYWVGMLVNLAFAPAAYLLSFAFGRPRSKLEGLTVWTQRSGPS